MFIGFVYSQGLKIYYSTDKKPNTLSLDSLYKDFYELKDPYLQKWNVSGLRNFDKSLDKYIRDNPYGNFDTVLAARLQFLLDSMWNYYIYNGYHLKGVSAAVLIPWMGTWTGVAGYSHNIIEITPGMKFAIASNTKLFIATMMLKLAEQNVLNLDDSLHRWLPHIQYVDSTTTIRQLLNHTSGIYNFTNHPAWWSSMLNDPNRVWMPEETLNTFMDTAYFAPGQGWEYSNTNYILAGLIIKTATNSQVSFQLRQNIFNPVSMEHTFFDVEETVPDTIAHCWLYNSYFSGTPRTSQYSSVWTAGAIFSNPENMVRWYYNLFSGNVINQNSLNQMLTFVPDNDGGYGLGIQRHSESDFTAYYHTGRMPGYLSACIKDSATGICFATLINSDPCHPIEVTLPLFNEVRHYLTGIVKIGEKIPVKFHLSQNYPNPFNPVTNIKFDLPNATSVKLTVFDILGREVDVLINQYLKPGTYNVDWDASNYPSGVYFYKLITADYTETKKMILIK
jgi:D-alanyl-D-alanine carboxypeptidase